ncbi:MAG: glycosyltransferase family 2 protein [Anaerolineaceae bacterium]|nr:glycosyltransferase family 2 protein [Anaerolineaceae bacterium]
MSVIIPCRNEEATIHKLLDSLFNQTISPDEYEIIIADGLSDDSTLDNIAKFKNNHPEMNISVVENSKQNIPAGLNCAINNSSGKYIIRLDAHSIPNNDYLDRCVTLLKNGTAENVGGLWIIHPSSDSLVAKAIAIAASHPLGVGGANYRIASSKSSYVDTVPFGAFLRSTLDKVGLFDETLLSNEDYELNARIIKSGGRIFLDSSIQCGYFARENYRKLTKQYWRYGFWKFKMLLRYPDTIRVRQALPPLFLLSLAVLFITSIINYRFFIFFIGEIIIYIAILFLGTHNSIRSTDEPLKMWVFTIFSILTMHFSWGLGFLYSAINSLISF